VASLRLNGGLCYDMTHFTHFSLFITCVLLLIGHLTDTLSHSILTLRSIAQSYCSYFPLFSILSSPIVLLRSHLDPIFLLSFVTHCSRYSIVLNYYKSCPLSSL
jgi:hypothetical protein